MWPKSADVLSFKYIIRQEDEKWAGGNIRNFSFLFVLGSSTCFWRQGAMCWACLQTPNGRQQAEHGRPGDLDGPGTLMAQAWLALPLTVDLACDLQVGDLV